MAYLLAVILATIVLCLVVVVVVDHRRKTLRQRQWQAAQKAFRLEGYEPDLGVDVLKRKPFDYEKDNRYGF